MVLTINSIRNTKIILVVNSAGDDLNLSLFGGEVGHVGAVTLGYISEEGVPHIASLSVPNHKECFLSEKLMKIILSRISHSVVLSCGIH